MSSEIENVDINAEQIAQMEELFNIKSKTGDIIDVTDKKEDAIDIANKNPGATVIKEGSEEVLYTSEEVVEEVVAAQPKKKNKAKHSKACVQVVAVDNVIKTVEPEIIDKPKKLILPGMMVRLDNQHIYKSAYIPQPFKLMTGNVFIYDAKLINGRYRIAANANKCGGNISNVIGYIPESYIK